MVTAPQEETTEEQKRRDLARRDASAGYARNRNNVTSRTRPVTQALQESYFGERGISIESK